MNRYMEAKKEDYLKDLEEKIDILEKMDIIDYLTYNKELY